MSQNHDSEVDKVNNGGIIEVEPEDQSPVLGRTKLPSSSRESRASDSGISAEFSNEPTGNRGTAHSQDVCSEGETTEVYNTADDEPSPLRPPTTPVITISQSPSPLASYDSTSADGERYNRLSAPPPSVAGNPSSSPSEPSSRDLSPLSPSCSSPYVIANGLEKLISGHLKKDSHWEPSGRYRSSHHGTLVQMEEDIGNTLSRKNKAREDARRVLEMFLENSLNADPNFAPSGHYRFKARKNNTSNKDTYKLQKTPDSPATHQVVAPRAKLAVPPSAPPPRPHSPTVRQDSTADRSSDVSGLCPNNRNSYYSALYDDFADDECLDEMTDALAYIRLASQESDDQPISLIPLVDGSTTEHLTNGEMITDMEATEDGVHIHRHIETERPLSSSTSLSSILDDGGVDDLGITNRKKKNFFTRASQRLRHAFNRIQRSDSRSESEADKYSVKPRRKPKKKKKTVKKGNSEVVDTKLLQSHQHHIKYSKPRLHGNAQIDGTGSGLNANIWREDNDDFKHGVVNKGKASTLPTSQSDYDKSSADRKKETEKEKAKRKEKWEKDMKELRKEAAKKSRKANRSESTHSNESLFKMWSLKRNSSKGETPSPRRERKFSFGLGSLMRPKKRSATEAPFPNIYIEGAGNEGSNASEQSPHQSAPAAGLQVPEQQMSKSAEQIGSPRHSSQPISKSALRLTPQHSRSRSAQDTTTSFTINASPATSHLPSSSSTKSHSPAEYQLTSAKSLSPTMYKKQYVPRSSPTKLLSAGSRQHLRGRRHTTQVEQSDMNGSRNRGSLRRNLHSATDEEQGFNLAPAGHRQDTEGIANHDMAETRKGLNLPLSVDANIRRTQSVATKKSGEKTLRTVTSVDGLVSLDNKRNKSRTSDMETDSEIERIVSIPQSERTQEEKEELYKHIAAKMSKLVMDLESDTSVYNTPMDEIGGRIAERNSSFLSARSSSTTSSHSHRETVDITSTGPGQYSASYRMEDIPETGGVNGDLESHTETTITQTNISELSAYIRDKGDAMIKVNPRLSTMFGTAMGQPDIGTYEVFEQVVDNMNTNDSLNQRIAAVFSVTLKAIKFVGKTGDVANRVKENALTYIENKFAQYIIGNGGWDSMLEEESSSELEVD